MNAHILQEFQFMAEMQLHLALIAAVACIPFLLAATMYGAETRRRDRAAHNTTTP